MLWTIAVILFVMWLLGFSFHLLENYIHILLVLAIVSVLIRVIRGQTPV